MLRSHRSPCDVLTVLRAPTLVVLATVSVGVLVGVGQMTALLGIIAVIALPLAAVIAHRHPYALVILIVGVSCMAAIVLLPSVRGEAGRRGAYEIYGIITGLAILLAALLALFNHGTSLRLVHLKTAPLDRILLCFLVLAGFSFCVGVLAGNQFSYVLSDTYRIVMLPVIYWTITLCVRSSKHAQSIISTLAALLVIQQARDGITAMSVLTAEGPARIDAVFWVQNLVAVLIFVALASGTDRPSRRVFFLAMAVVVLLIGLASAFRTYIGVLALVAICMVLLRRGALIRSSRQMIPPIVLAALVVVVVGLAVPSVQRVATTSIETLTLRFDRFLSGDENTAQGRSAENAAILARMREQPMRFITGFGVGAEYDLPLDASIYAAQLASWNEYRVHNIHNSYTTMLFRSGLAGVVLLVALFLAGLRLAYRVPQVWSSPLAWVPFLIVLTFAACSWFFYFVPGDIVFAVGLGLAGAVLRSAPSDT